MLVQEWLGEDNQLGIDIWERKYRYNNESFDEWLDRVSGGNETVANMIKEKKFLFGGRILANRGLNNDGKKISLSNCYVISPPEDNIESIFECASKLARTYSYGGGCGVDISKLSPRGATIHNAAKETSGAVSFMDLYSLVTGLIGQSGRRGALMISISCDHPDLEEFIGIKSDLDKITKANISIRITDKFMVAVKNKTPFELKFTRIETGEEIVKTVNAYDLFHKICEMNWDYAEPGMLFWDRINNWNLLSCDEEFEYAGTNPCFAGDMELLTDKGYKKFEDLCGTEVNIYNINGNITKSKVWCSGEKKTVRVKTGRGEIVCTPDHRFMTIDGNECQAKDLKDKFIMPFTNSNKVFDSRFVKYGFIQGDGQLNNLSESTGEWVEVNVGKKDTDIRELFADEDYKETSHRAIHVSGFKDDLIRLGFSEKTLPEREFPSTYIDWTIGQKASFLHGCYSANGSVIKNGRISYKTTCAKFADQLKQTLEEDFDIRDVYITTNKSKDVEFANGTYKCKESYDVNICKCKEISKFVAEINFYQQYKREQLAQMLRSTKATYVYNVTPGDTIKVYDFTEPERHWGVVEGCVVHNCAEEPLPSGGSCLLGSINLSAFSKNKNFDFDEFRKVVHDSVIALNEVLDEGLSLHPLQEQRDSVRDWRQIGLGIFGLADLLIKMGITYGSNEAVDLCDMIGHAMADEALRTSSELARKYGAYPKFNLEAVTQSAFYSKNALGETKDMVMKYGLHNSQLLTIAPTGTLSTMIGVSGGIEPIFANYYTRKTESLYGHDEYYKVYTPIVQEYMDKHGLKDDSELPEFFVTAQTLNFKNRINMQAIWQTHIDASISSTVNVPNEFTVKETEDLYMYAWESGLKGVTIYRDGCKRGGILTTTKKESNTEESDDGTVSMSALKRGVIIRADDNCVGLKRTLHTGCGTLHCEAFFDPDSGDLLETYFSKGSSGGCNNFMIGLSRMISLAARGGVNIWDIVDQLKSSGTCPSYAVRSAMKHDTSKGSCCPVAIGNALIDMYKEMQSNLSDDEEYEELEHKEPAHIKPQTETSKAKCPHCGGNLVFEGGCNTCKNCGWSKCD